MENTPHNKIRVIAMVVVGIAVLAGMIWFLNKYLFRSRAAGANASLSLPSTLSGNVNDEVDVPVTLSSDGAELIAADVVLDFDKAMLSVTDITINSAIINSFSFFPRDSSGAFDKAQVIARANSNGKVEIGAASHPGEPNAPGYNGSGIVGSVKFKFLQPGTTTIAINFASGATNDSNLVDRSGDILAQVTNATVTIAGSAGPTNTPVPGATDTPVPAATDTPTPAPIATNTPAPIATNTPAPGSTSTPVPPGNPVVMNLKLKFQGIPAKPKLSKTVLVQVVVAGDQLSAPITKSLQVTPDASGIFSGSVAFPEVGAGTGYRVYLKGPMQVRKKICVSKPKETANGSYHCVNGSIPLNSGSNDLDFTGISLMGGDLPDDKGVQDGVINRDDISFIAGNLSSTDPNIIARGDINMDGVVNAQDYSLLIESLSVRYDEE